MTAERPAGWYWSHDIAPDQLPSVLLPAAQLLRLSTYGQGARRRFAALLHTGSAALSAEPGWVLELDAATLAGWLPGRRAVAITVSDDGPRYSVVLGPTAGPPTTVHLDLSEADLRALPDERHAILDLATYLAAGRRTFAAIVEPRTAPSRLFTGLRPRELTAQLRGTGLAPVRLRAYYEAGEPLLAAVAAPAPRRSSWYADLDADTVARRLDRRSAYPTDLDAVRTERGVRFTVTMSR
jgi:hypothetical protein